MFGTVLAVVKMSARRPLPRAATSRDARAKPVRRESDRPGRHHGRVGQDGPPLGAGCLGLGLSGWLLAHGALTRSLARRAGSPQAADEPQRDRPEEQPAAGHDHDPDDLADLVAADGQLRGGAGRGPVGRWRRRAGRCASRRGRWWRSGAAWRSRPGRARSRRAARRSARCSTSAPTRTMTGSSRPLRRLAGNWPLSLDSVTDTGPSMVTRPSMRLDPQRASGRRRRGPR